MRTTLPENGTATEEVLAQLDTLRAGDADWRSGKTWCLVYHAGEEHSRLIKEAYLRFFSENLLNPMAFKSLKRMETEVVQMTAGMLHAPETAVGSMTSGGTESILSAVHCYRERARRKRPWIRHPEMVMPVSAHVAFDKAAGYFGIKPVRVPLRDDFTVDTRAFRRRIGRNTILLVGSAPQYPHGVIDPIAELGEIALRKRLPLHVDGCIGGFLLPWVERAGWPVPAFDFRVDGVTSMSADVHKYGYAAKGASVVVWRSMDYMRHQFFISTAWSGGIYASPNMQGTRAGGTVAAAWAAMMGLGRSGYVRLAKRTMEATDSLRAAVEAVDGVEILGEPAMGIFAIGASERAINMFAVADRLQAQGWHFDLNQRPPSIHLTVSASNVAAIEPFVADLRAAVEHVRSHPEAAREGSAPMYGLMAKMNVEGLVHMGVRKVMEQMYAPDGEVPDLTQPGAGGEDDALMGLIDRYGATAVEVLDRLGGAVDAVRARLPGGRR